MGIKVFDDMFKGVRKMCKNDDTCVLFLLIFVGLVLCMLFNKDGFMGAPLDWNDNLSQLLNWGTIKRFFGFGPMVVPRTLAEQRAVESGGKEGVRGGVEGFTNEKKGSRCVPVAGLTPKPHRQDPASASLKDEMEILGPVKASNFGCVGNTPGIVGLPSEVQSYGGVGTGYAPANDQFVGASTFDYLSSLDSKDPVPLSMSSEENAATFGGAEGQGGSAYNVTLYYAPWCPHCKAMVPEFKKFQDKHHGNKLGDKLMNIFMVNSDEEPEKVKEAGVKGFPEVRINGESKSDFPRTDSEKMEGYVNK